MGEEGRTVARLLSDSEAPYPWGDRSCVAAALLGFRGVREWGEHTVHPAVTHGALLCVSLEAQGGTSQTVGRMKRVGIESLSCELWGETCVQLVTHARAGPG